MDSVLIILLVGRAGPSHYLRHFCFVTPSKEFMIMICVENLKKKKISVKFFSFFYCVFCLFFGK